MEATVVPAAAVPGPPKWAPLGGALYVYAALASTAASLGNAVRTMSDDTFQHRVFPELIHAADDATWVIQTQPARYTGTAAPARGA